MMRERERIQRILNLVNTIWEQQPDLRFHQLMSNLQHLYSMQNNDYGKRKIIERWESGDINKSYLDFFYLEDDEWESFLMSLVANKTRE